MFTQEASRIMMDLLGYECNRLKPEDSERKAEELFLAYDKFIAKFKADDAHLN